MGEREALERARQILRALREYLRSDEGWKQFYETVKRAGIPQDPVYGHLHDQEQLLKMIDKALEKLESGQVRVDILKGPAEIYPVEGMPPVIHLGDVLHYQRGGRIWESPLPQNENAAHFWTRGGYIKLSFEGGKIEAKFRPTDNHNALTVSRAHGVVFPHEGGIAVVGLGRNPHRVRKL